MVIYNVPRLPDERGDNPNKETLNDYEAMKTSDDEDPSWKKEKPLVPGELNNFEDASPRP